MAGLHSSLRPTSSSSSSSHSSAQSSQVFNSKILLLLTLLPLSLAAFAFVLQWRGEIDDPTTRWSPKDRLEFPGMDAYTSSTHTTRTSSNCADLLGQSRSVSFPYYRDWKFDYISDLKPKICITTSTSAGLEQILPWIFYHKVIGVSTFFLFVEGKAASPTVSKVLESIPEVKVIYRTRELEAQQAKRGMMQEEANLDWILHLDTDELIHPAGTREYSLRKLLSDESSVERDDIRDPFSEVSLFKKNYDHLPKDTYFGNYKESTRGNPNYFLTYGNGKSAARIQHHLRPNGAHRWHNYMKNPNEIKLEEAAVLHYTYTKFSDLTSRRDRCGCKPTKDDVKRCFMLEFDRAAFIIASTATEEEMLSWKGILARIYTPMVIMQELREAGTFSSLIASTQRSPSLLSSIKDSNTSSKAIEGLDTLSKKTEESEMMSRKVLEVADVVLLAVPPLPPPSADDDHDM
ncbi:hypothetical protein Ccrd_003165 [Cynara cardunculus var. scolymus]|uniref:Glycosyltransferase family 92 protein n=1 Tax=Cynara cardunculus var. scolymus TaxID=59895 RepID=A0A103XPY5_CYNCS|nr:hypothetical protein Ccrd_003165 [Cynara cardunculus var. scolymus]